MVGVSSGGGILTMFGNLLLDRLRRLVGSPGGTFSSEPRSFARILSRVAPHLSSITIHTTGATILQHHHLVLNQSPLCRPCQFLQRQTARLYFIMVMVNGSVREEVHCHLVWMTGVGGIRPVKRTLIGLRYC